MHMLILVVFLLFAGPAVFLASHAATAVSVRAAPISADTNCGSTLTLDMSQFNRFTVNVVGTSSVGATLTITDSAKHVLKTCSNALTCSALWAIPSRALYSNGVTVTAQIGDCLAAVTGYVDLQ